MGYFNTRTLRATDTGPMVCDLGCSCQMQIFVYMQSYAGFLNCIPFWRDVSTPEGGVGMGMMGNYVKNQNHPESNDFRAGILPSSLVFRHLLVQNLLAGIKP